MWPDRVSNPGPLTYKSGARPTALRDPATLLRIIVIKDTQKEITSQTDLYLLILSSN